MYNPIKGADPELFKAYLKHNAEKCKGMDLSDDPMTKRKRDEEFYKKYGGYEPDYL